MTDKLFEIIKQVQNHAQQNYVPIVRPQTLQKLLEVCKERGVESVLEIGTATGYSGLNLLTIPNLSLTTIEKEEGRFMQAKENFALAEVESRVEQICGDAGQVLQKLADDGRKFDLVFLDGPKGQYKKYLQNIVKLLTKNGIIFADNILLGGLLNDESRVTHKNRTMVRNMKEFLSVICDETCFESKIYQIEDGFAICEVKNF